MVNIFRYHHEQSNVESIAFVLMPDHFHWLFSLGSYLSLSTIIASIKRTSSRKLNQLNKKIGSIWQKGYYDHALRKEEDIKKISRYIVANPLRAGLVDQIGDYPLWDAKWL